MADLKRAPAPTWGPLTALLRSLEVGESGVLRVEDAALTGLPAEYEWLNNGETWVPVLKSTCLDSLFDGEGWVLDRPVSPPLRPGRYWVPEEWWCCHIVDGLWTFEYRSEAEAPPWPNQQVVMPIHWSPQHRHGWFSPWHLPARAARLACEVGEERVEAWCEACQGSRRKVLSPPRAKADGTFSCSHAIVCPTCSGEPGPWWVYDVERTEVE